MSATPPVPLDAWRRQPWLPATCAALLVGLALRWVAGLGDPLSYDDYALMVGVDEPLADYLGVQATYQFPQRIHYWFSARLFGGDLAGYLVLPVLSAMATLLLLHAALRRLWDEAALPFCVLALLACNLPMRHLAGYAIWPYANGLLATTALYLLFLRLAHAPLGRRAWLWVFLASVPAAFFSTLVTLVPLCAGALCVVWMRGRRGAGWVRGRLATLGELAPLLVFPLTYGLVYWLHPFTNLGLARRPDMARYFLYSSEFPGSLQGAWQFLREGFRQLTRPMFRPLDRWTVFGTLIGIGVALGAGRLLLPRRRPAAATARDRRSVRFTLLYVLVALGATAFGGLTGKFPYGALRYADFLLPPAAVLAGFAVARLLAWIPASWGRGRAGRVAPWLLAGAVLAAGGAFAWDTGTRRAAEKRDTRAVLAALPREEADVVLYSAYFAPILARRAPGLLDRPGSFSMGWGSMWRGGSDGGVPPRVETALAGGARRVLVVLTKELEWESQFGSYARRLARDFVPVERARPAHAMNVHVLAFERRDASPR